MATTPAAAGAAVSEELGGQHEQPGLRIEIASLAGLYRGRMSREDLRPPWMPRIQPLRMRLVRSPRRQFHPPMLSGPSSP
jgi:hypothetical protein